MKKLLSSSLVNSTLIYGGFSALNKAVPFLLLPVFTRLLSPEDFGLLSLFTVLVNILTPFIGLNTHGAVSRAYFARDRFRFPSYVGNVFLVILASSAVLLVLLYAGRGAVQALFSFPAEWLWAVFAVSAGGVVIQVCLVVWQVEFRAARYGLFQNLMTAAEIAVALFFILKLRLGWEGRVWSKVLVFSSFAVAALLLLRREGKIALGARGEYVRHALGFGVPLIPHTLSPVINSAIGRVLIVRMIGLADTGLYSVGYQIGLIISILEDSFNKAFVPWLFGKLSLDSEAWRRKIVRLTYAYFAGIALAAVLLSAAAPWFMRWFVSESFRQATSYILWIALGYAFHGMYKMVVNYIFYSEKTGLLPFVTFGCSVLNAVLSYVLIRRNGAIGAAQATTLVHLFTFLLTWYLSARVYRMPWFSRGE